MGNLIYKDFTYYSDTYCGEKAYNIKILDTESVDKLSNINFINKLEDKNVYFLKNTKFKRDLFKKLHYNVNIRRKKSLANTVVVHSQIVNAIKNINSYNNQRRQQLLYVKDTDKYYDLYSKQKLNMQNIKFEQKPASFCRKFHFNNKELSKQFDELCSLIDDPANKFISTADVFRESNSAASQQNLNFDTFNKIWKQIDSNDPDLQKIGADFILSLAPAEHWDIQILFLMVFKTKLIRYELSQMLLQSLRLQYPIPNIYFSKQPSANTVTFAQVTQIFTVIDSVRRNFSNVSNDDMIIKLIEKIWSHEFKFELNGKQLYSNIGAPKIKEEQEVVTQTTDLPWAIK